ncbi:MAG TPA: trypsin-like peptidase domain-containing protein [Acetobacteraceae bacterium]|nr:trypsin-like peptidase domain-containing protein [Acetobacteraceae bacterium]
MIHQRIRVLHQRIHVLRVMAMAMAIAIVVAALAAISPANAAPTSTCDAANVVARVLPAVVNIWVAKILHGDEEGGNATGKQRLEFFVGTGFIVDPGGIIVTNKHVIQDAAMILVAFRDRSQVPAQLIAASSLSDFALLKVNTDKPLPILRYADSDTVQLGQPVIAVGNPLGLGTSVSTGVVSAVNRNLMKTPVDDFIQTDASINPGNSGGPLLDCSGQVVGINTALLSNNTVLGSIGIGFALPSNCAQILQSYLLDPNHVSLNWAGLELQDLTPGLAQSFGGTFTSGAIVTGLEKDGPAAKASLEPGDIITAVNGHPMYDARAVQRTIALKRPGDPVQLTVWRDGNTSDMTVIGKPWPDMLALRTEVLASASSIQSAQSAGAGLHLANITPAERSHYGLSDASGVMIDRVSAGSEAESLGLAVGDVIKMVGGHPATTPDAVTSRLDHPDLATGDLVPLLVQSKSVKRWVAVYVGRINVADLVTTVPEAKSAAAPVLEIRGMSQTKQ